MIIKTLKMYLEKNFYSLFFYLCIIIDNLRWTTNFYPLKMFGFKAYEVNKINSKKVCYIFGSGPSICKLPKTLFQDAKKNFSIGINNWILHPFKPDILITEFYKDEEQADNLTFLNNIRNQKEKFKKTIFLYQDCQHPKRSFFAKLSTLICVKKILGDKVFLLRHKVIPGDTAFGLKKSVDKIISSKRLKNAIWKKRGSLITSIFLARKMCFENVVICGFNPNTRAYFYDKLKIQNNLQKPKNNDDKFCKNKLHKTESRSYGVPISEILKILISKYFSTTGISLKFKK